MLNIIAGTLSVGVTPSTNSYESIATVSVGSGGAADVTFSSIPATYTHLQIRGIARGSNASSFAGLRVQLGNGSIDTTSNYSAHDLYGDGSTVASSGSSSRANMYASEIAAASLTASIFGVTIIDILDYKDTNKYKTIRSLGGVDGNGSGYTMFTSGNWRSTSAITDVKIICSTGNFSQYSQFALYGIKGS